jgi:hypothetical protein
MPATTEPTVYTRLCAWCQRRIGPYGWSQGPRLSEAEVLALAPVTHGLCEGCRGDLESGQPHEEAAPCG